MCPGHTPPEIPTKEWNRDECWFLNSLPVALQCVKNCVGASHTSTSFASWDQRKNHQWVMCDSMETRVLTSGEMNQWPPRCHKPSPESPYRSPLYLYCPWELHPIIPFILSIVHTLSPSTSLICIFPPPPPDPSTSIPHLQHPHPLRIASFCPMPLLWLQPNTPDFHCLCLPLDLYFLSSSDLSPTPYHSYPSLKIPAFKYWVS